MSIDVIFLSNVRLSFPNLVEPQKLVNEQTGVTRSVYNCEFILPNDHPGLAKFFQDYAAAATEKWKEHAQQVMGMIHQDRKLRCYGIGAEKINKKTFQVYKGYEGMSFISASRETPPQMIKPDGKPNDPANTMEYVALARRLYGGCYVNAAIKPWLQENKHGRGIRCDLVALQFLSDGEAFGEGNVDASGLFGAVAAAPAAPGFAAPGAAVPGFAQPPATTAASPMGLPPFAQPGGAAPGFTAPPMPPGMFRPS